MRGTIVFCRSLPTTLCFVKILKKDLESNQRQNENERQNQHITRQPIGRPRLKRYAQDKYLIKNKGDDSGRI